MIDFSTRMYHKLAWPILRMTFPSMVLLFAGLVFFQGFVLPGLLTTRDADNVTVQLGEVIVVYVIALFVALPVVVIALGHSVGLTTQLISDFVMEQRIDLAAAARSARVGAWTMVRLMLQIFIRSGVVLMAAGALMLVSASFEQSGAVSGFGDLAAVFAVLAIIVGFAMVPIVMSSLSLAPAIAVVEGATPREAIARSRTLMRKSRHIPSGYDTLFHLWIVSLFVAFVLWLGFYTVFASTGLGEMVTDFGGRSVLMGLIAQTVETVPTFAALWVLVPFMTCCVTVLYYDRRVRLEALDIETMAHDVLKGSEKADLRA